MTDGPSEFESFSFMGAGTSPIFLKVNDGCYLRARDITAVTVGAFDEAGAVVHEDTVYVHTGSGLVAAFPPCETKEAALERMASLTAALCKAQAAAFSQLLPDVSATR